MLTCRASTRWKGDLMAYPQSIKNAIIKRARSGENVTLIADETGITRCTIYRWLKGNDGKLNGTHPTDPTKLLAHNDKNEHIIDILQKADVLLLIPLPKRLDIAKDLYDSQSGYSVHEICQALNIARGTFYNRIFRSVKKDTVDEDELTLMLAVKNIFNESNQVFGAEKIRQVLINRGICISKRRVRRIMDELELESVHLTSKSKNRKQSQGSNIRTPSCVISRHRRRIECGLVTSPRSSNSVMFFLYLHHC